MPPKKNFIQGAIKRPGRLHAIAAKDDGLTQRGTIKAEWLRRHEHDSGLLGREVRLALTLRKLPNRK